MGHQAPLTVLVVAALACSETPASLPPYGQVILSIDTDLPAPAIAGRMRVDLYGQDGTWFESRDLAVPDASAWPLSFGTWSDDPVNDKLAIARIRIYPEGRLRDYAGPPLESPSGEATPAQEPLPPLTVDRLVLVHVRPSVVAQVSVVLRGACMGTVPTLGTLSTSSTCTDTGGVLVPLTEPPTGAPQPSVVNTFGSGVPCPETTTASYVCVPAGAFVFGGLRFANLNVESSAPERLAVMSRFAIDRNEVTVAEYRDALSKGLAPGGLSSSVFVPQTGSACVYTDTPGPNESAPLNCVYWESARAYCQLRGGDLPSEAQWERAATTSFPGALKPRFPWGDTPPDCSQASWGRAYDAGTTYPPFSQDCAQSPGPFAELGDGGADVSHLGIVDMGGSMAEWTLDDARSFLDPAWAAAPLVDPVVGPSAMYTIRTARGGSWRSNADGLDTLTRDFEQDKASNLDYVGFRCVYTTPPGGWW